MRKRSGIERLRRAQNKKLSDLDKYVIFSLSNIVVFTIVSIIYQWTSDDELSSTLITCFFSCFGGELLLLAMIKRLKLKKGDSDNE